MNINIIASGSTGNAYLVGDGSTTLLLDAGITLKEIQVACKFKLRNIKGCLVTHCHGDHSKACKDLAKYGINIYTSQGTIDECQLSGHRIKPIRALDEFTIGSFKVLPFDVEHDAQETLGFLICSRVTGEKLLYFTDTYYLKYRFNGLTHIMGECNYELEGVRRSIEDGRIPPEMLPRLLKSHMSLKTFLGILKANDISKIKQIYLLHLSQNNSNKDRFKREVQKITGTEVYTA